MDTEKNETDSKTATEDKESDQSAEKSMNTEESNNSQEKEGKQDEGQTEGLKTQEDPDSNTNTVDAKGGKPGQEGEITLDSLPEIKVLEDVESLILEGKGVFYYLHQCLPVSESSSSSPALRNPFYFHLETIKCLYMVPIAFLFFPQF